MLKQFYGLCAALTILAYLTSAAAWADDCPNPPGWLPHNLPELLFEHRIWATEVLPPDINDPRRLNLCHADLSGLDLSDVNLSDANLSITRNVGVNFKRANLTGARFDGAYIKDSDFEGANMTRASLPHVEITGSRFAHADMAYSLFQDVKIRASDFTGSRLDKAKFWQSELSDLKMHNAAIRRSIFIDSRLTEIDLSGADLSHTKFLSTYFDHVNFYFADLSRAYFSQTKLQNVNFKDALLYLADLKYIDIGPEKRDLIAKFCLNLTSARDWQLSYRHKKFRCGAKILPGKYNLSIR